MIRSFLVFLIPLVIIFNGCGQSTTSSNKNVQSNSSKTDTSKDLIVGGPCDRCDEMFYAGKPSAEKIESSVIIAGKSEPGERMEISGSVYLSDGKSPAKDVILYAYHTNAAGLYAPSDTQTVGRVNGRLRNWVKTDSSGHYDTRTIRPAPYPGNTIPTPIQATIQNNNGRASYNSDFVFKYDSLVTGH